MRRRALLVLPLMLASSLAAQQMNEPAATSTAPAANAAVEHSAKEPRIPKDKRDAAQKDYMQGARALAKNDPQAALEAFNRAAGLDPGNRRYRFAAEIAQQHVVQSLVQQADKARIIGHYQKARAAITQAYRIDPTDPMLAQHLDEVAADEQAGQPVIRLDEPQIDGPIRLQPQPGRHSFHLNTNVREAIRQVMTAYGIQANIDDSVGAQSIRYDVDNVDFAEAERTLALATNSFFVPLDAGRVLSAKDTTENHHKFDRMGLETLYLPSMPSQDLSEMANMVKNVFYMQTATTTPGQSALTVRGPVGDLPALNATLKHLVEGRGELQLDVRLYEVDRTKARNLGAILPNQTTVFNVYSEATQILQQNSSLVQQIISSGLAAPGDWEAILAILVASGQLSNTIFNNPIAVFGGGLTLTGVEIPGGASLNMQLNSTDVHAIDQVQLRVSDGQQGVIKIGERYPIETSSYSSLSGTGLNIPGLSTAGISNTLSNLGVNLSALQSAATESIPQVQYQDIGLTLDVTPHFQGRNRISLKFDLKLNALQGASLNSLPVLNNREYATIASMEVGQSALLMSSLSRQESEALTGYPGLSDLPGFEAFTNQDSNFDYSELAIVITPHLVRPTPREFAGQMVLLPHEP
ncbi:MAG TPA: hypothetical protein VKT75_20350 [Acidobacteriaceae bacterium]|nr:hypothetical protein [Acidobacteriaceae bacterium]